MKNNLDTIKVLVMNGNDMINLVGENELEHLKVILQYFHGMIYPN